uniref:Uncharacterized protein n=1 Tax=Biomphalaria glabrata TaxID=6526 RepID=A0A2C9LT40_BIOGL
MDPEVVSLIFLLLLLLLPCRHGQTSKSETCEYDLDLTRNTIKITCIGSPSLVNIYADKAVVQSEELSSTNPETVVEHPVLGELYQPRPGHNTSSGHEENYKTEKPNVPSKPSSRDQRPLPTVHWDRRAHSKVTESFWDVITNASNKLESAKRSFSVYAESIRNISGQLAEGDFNLRQDMDNLRRTSNSATDLKEGIIAAMSNQYNYMRSALLSRNFELERLVTSLLLLVDATSDGLSSALKAHNSSLKQVTKSSSFLFLNKL